MFTCLIRPDAELRILEPRHAEEIYRVVDAHRGDIREWLAWVDRSRAPVDVLEYINRGLAQFARNEGFQAGLWWKGQYSGGIGIVRIDWPNLRSEIGYWLAPPARGNGLITDGCRKLIHYLFEDLNLNRIEMRVAVGNEPSVNVARRLGATMEGIDRQSSMLNGKLVDMQRFALLRRGL